MKGKPNKIDWIGQRWSSWEMHGKERITKNLVRSTVGRVEHDSVCCTAAGRSHKGLAVYGTNNNTFS